MSKSNQNRVVFALAVIAYFAAYPEDAEAIAAPMKTFLGVSSSISPWLYATVAFGVIAFTILKCRGIRIGATKPGNP